MAEHKTYLGKPQLHIEKRGKIFKFTTPNKEKFYVLASYIQCMIYGRKSFVYANVYTPYKTAKALKAR